MTVGEISAIVRHAERERYRLAAFTAYYTAGLSLQKKFPASLKQAFPSLFGRTDTGGIPAENWRESEAAMDRIMRAVNARNARNRRKG